MAILHDVNCDYGAGSGKMILKIVFGGTEGKVPDE